MRIPLLIHPDGAAPAVTALDVEIARTPGLLALVYRVAGRIDGVAWPAPAAPARADELWKHTCFEAFIAAAAGYYEFNFSPSGRWAFYRFDSYRAGMRNAEMAPPRIALSAGADELELRVTFAPPADALGRLALTAVIEAADGGKSYWALKHPPGQPDFHHADGFALDLPSPEQT